MTPTEISEPSNTLQSARSRCNNTTLLDIVSSFLVEYAACQFGSAVIDSKLLQDQSAMANALMF